MLFCFSVFLPSFFVLCLVSLRNAATFLSRSECFADDLSSFVVLFCCFVLLFYLFCLGLMDTVKEVYSKG